MHFSLHCHYKQGALQQRLALREMHKAHVFLLADRLTVEVPLFEDDGATMVGSLMIADFESRAAVDSWLENDPFARHGIYDRVSIRPFLKAKRQRTGAYHLAPSY